MPPGVQPFDMLKSPAGKPTLLIVTAELPELVTLMVCWLELVLITWLGKTSLGRSTTILGAATRPFPEIEVVRGLPGASSVIVTVAVLSPLAVGVNVTATVQVWFGSTVEGDVGQLLVMA